MSEATPPTDRYCVPVAREHAQTALPPVVSAEGWQTAREELLEAEKEHTRAGDRLAAARRRLPMVEVDAELVATGPRGETTLLDMFEGRRQLIIYHHMLRAGDKDPCAGCSSFVDHVPNLVNLNVSDVTFTIEAAAPLQEIQAYMDRMGRPDIPVYSSATSSFRDVLHPTPHRTALFGLNVFLRDGRRVYRTYTTRGRGVAGTALLDLTPYGRQETFENSPAGWPQRPTYSFGKVHYDYTSKELAGLAAPSSTGQTS
jgi:predicted dithiol-disulfide oxidoreductase (DUF899 family)